MALAPQRQQKINTVLKKRMSPVLGTGGEASTQCGLPTAAHGDARGLEIQPWGARGDIGVRDFEILPISTALPGGRMPPSMAGGDARHHVDYFVATGREVSAGGGGAGSNCKVFNTSWSSSANWAESVTGVSIVIRTQPLAPLWKK